MSRDKRIVMVGTSFDGMGGVSSVVNGYREAGLFSRFPITYLATHSNGSAWLKLRYFLMAWTRFQLMLWRGRVSILHVHMSSNASFWRKLLFCLPAYRFGIPAILHLHGGAFDLFYEANDNVLKKYLIRRVFDRASCVIVLSEARRQWVCSIAPRADVRTIYNAVPIPALHPGQRRDRASILFLGQLGEAKGVYDLLQALAKLRLKHPQLMLLLGGDGPRQAVQAAADELGLSEHVTLLGWVSGNVKRMLLQKATIYALPSYAEGMPMSVLEAMAAGMPVVATAVGGVPEAITTGVEGTLIAPGDVAGLTSALDRLLVDVALRDRMGQRARDRAIGAFSYERVIPQIELLYCRLLEAGPAETLARSSTTT
jgi:glycosyltransferase involved in cell wall biosynthesis